jgi:hypothetical protein
VSVIRARFGPDGRLRQFRQTNHRFAEGRALPARSTVAVDVDTLIALVTVEESGAPTRTLRLAADLPIVPWTSWFAILDFVSPLLPRPVGSSLPFRLVDIEASTSRIATITRASADSLTLGIFMAPGTATLDETGRVRRAEYAASTNKYVAERVGDFDVGDAALAFHEADRARRGLGVLSPRDSLELRVGAARMILAYGRPAKRGRVVFGGVVPFGEVWRTGANWATYFRTDRDLGFGDTVLPAGQYTLWTVPGPDLWTLIINGEVGQFGTAYQGARDVARVPMDSPGRGPPLERLRLTIEETRDGGRLVIAWDTTVVGASFRILPGGGG